MTSIALEGVLPYVSRPARYTAGEWNSITKDWSRAKVRFALAYPDIYDIGMSNLGLAILYDTLNRIPDVVAERVFAPWLDMEQEMRRQGIPLFSLETRRPLADFDVIGFSLSYELTYTNLVNMIDLAGLPVLAQERGQHHPLIIAGGSGALNPDPLSLFVDAFALGDGEELVVDIAHCLREWKEQGGGPRIELLRRLAAIPGIYVPCFYRVTYHQDGTVRRIEPTDPTVPSRVRKRILAKLPPPPTRPIVPYLQTVQDRATIEIQRGCTQGCRFCQAGMIYRPRLERSVQEVVQAAVAIIANTGYKELSLVSLSTTDHSHITDMVEALKAQFGQAVSISLPSLRVDSFSARIAQAVAGGGKRGITLAPEAGSQRLRHAINKLVSDEATLAAAEAAFSSGFSHLKLYFMVGLPTETMADVQGIVDMAARIKDIGRRHHGGRTRVRVSVATFIPKPHTPFQWAAQSSPQDLAAKYELLRQGCRRAGLELSWEEQERGLLEAVLSRGDRRLSAAILRAWQKGCKFDAWTEVHNWPRWQEALMEEGLSAQFYAQRQRDLWEVFPWDHIDIGVTKAYLRGEWLKTWKGQTTDDCAPHKGPCNVCGVQDLAAEGCIAKLAELKQERRSRKGRLLHTPH